MRRIVVDELLGTSHPRGGGQWFAQAQIAAPAGMSAAANLQPDAMAAPETIRGGPQLDRNLQRSIGLRLTPARPQPHETITQVDRAAIRVHVAQARYKIGVSIARADDQLHARRSDHFNLFV
jgi:hypothetical protein